MPACHLQWQPDVKFMMGTDGTMCIVLLRAKEVKRWLGVERLQVFMCTSDAKDAVHQFKVRHIHQHLHCTSSIDLFIQLGRV